MWEILREEEEIWVERLESGEGRVERGEGRGKREEGRGKREEGVSWFDKLTMTLPLLSQISSLPSPLHSPLSTL